MLALAIRVSTRARNCVCERDVACEASLPGYGGPVPPPSILHEQSSPATRAGCVCEHRNCMLTCHAASHGPDWGARTGVGAVVFGTPQRQPQPALVLGGPPYHTYTAKKEVSRTTSKTQSAHVLVIRKVQNILAPAPRVVLTETPHHAAVACVAAQRLHHARDVTVRGEDADLAEVSGRRISTSATK